MIANSLKSLVVATFTVGVISLSAAPASAVNKQELVNEMASKANISKSDADRALKAFIDMTGKALSKGDRVSIVGFGSFSVSNRAARTGRNPQTGKPIKIPAKKIVKFKPGAELSKQVN